MAKRVGRKFKYVVTFSDACVDNNWTMINVELLVEQISWIENELPGYYQYETVGVMTFSNLKAATMFKLRYG